METCTIFSRPVVFFLRLGEGERKVYRFDRIILLRSESSRSLLNRDGMCRHFQSTLLKKTADGNRYVKERLFSKLVGLRFFNSDSLTSREEGRRDLDLSSCKTILTDSINDDDDDDDDYYYYY